jgi:Fe2+ or Zn2+ uptake regulation protein
MSVSVERLKDTLLAKGLRASYQRIKVLEYLHNYEGHPTADEIYRFLSPEIPSLSKTTIYNILHSFTEAGILRIINIDDNEVRYDIMLSNHGHFKCESCGSIINFSIDIDKIPIVGLNRFAIKERNVFFKGLCPNCINKINLIEKEK